jgi:hypothetical protein
MHRPRLPLGIQDTSLTQRDAAEEAHLEERLDCEFEHPVTGHRPHRTVTISGNHSPLPTIVNVTHESLETGMVDLIMFQEVL